MRGEMRHDAGKQGSLDFEVFGDSFDDPVALREFGKVVVERAGSDERGARRVEKSCGLGFCERIESGESERTFRGPSFWSKIEEKNGDSGVGQMCGDAGAHGSRAENGDAANEERLSIFLRSGSCGRGSGAH